MNKILVYRSIVTPDGTELPTLHHYDYKNYVDKITGETYMIDGGLDEYYRCSVNDVPFKLIEFYLDDDISILRNKISKDGILISEMDNNLLKDSIDSEIKSYLINIYERELEYRKLIEND
jgi:hypothetical protein